MKKQLLLLCLFFGLCLSAEAQKMLKVEDTTEGIGVYPCGDRHEALVIFRCREAFDLVFDSNYDQNLLIDVDSVAGVKSYKIVFVTQAPGVDYSGRRIYIKAPGFNDYILPLNLKDKQKFEYTVSDPYSNLRSPFFLYQEQGNEKFYAGDYQGAKDFYLMVRACPEYESNREVIDTRLALCDSMILWNINALQEEHYGKYRNAYSLYMKMMAYNSGNEYIQQKAVSCTQLFNSDCEAEFTLADRYKSIKEYDKAIECYNRIIEKGCSNRDEAADEMASVKSLLRKQEMHARTFLYDYGNNLPLGFSYMMCREDRTGGYFTLRFNKSDIDLASKKSYVEGEFTSAYKDKALTTAKNVTTADELFTPSSADFDRDEKDNYIPKEFDAEAAISFGWVIHVWSPIFIHFTPFGYHGGGFCTFDGEEWYDNVSDLSGDNKPSTLNWAEWSTKAKNEASKLTWGNAWAPEVGLVLKYWRVAAKFTYQYNYWIGTKDKYQDLYDDNVHKFYFGLGFCW
jgi:tetratricopeptide (TPR) repeat protein